MKKIYVAAPLFNEMELERNLQMKKELIKWGYDVFLPQDEAGLLYDSLKDDNKIELYRNIFLSDVECVKKSDIVLFLLDGRVPDEGGCVEVGMAYAWGKKCIGYKTDSRALDYTGDDNLMILGCFDFRVAKNLEDLRSMLEKYC